MTTTEQRLHLLQIVNEINLARVFKDVDDLVRRIEKFVGHYATKSQGVARGALPATRVSLDGLLAEFRSSPHRVQALLQAMAFLCTPEMLVMIWMSELGCAIQRLTLDYERHDRAVLSVQLRLLDGSHLSFTSSEVWDLAVLRLVGLAKSDEQPEMSGFYPLFLPEPSQA